MENASGPPDTSNQSVIPMKIGICRRIERTVIRETNSFNKLKFNENHNRHIEHIEYLDFGFWILEFLYWLLVIRQRKELDARYCMQDVMRLWLEACGLRLSRYWH